MATLKGAKAKGSKYELDLAKYFTDALGIDVTRAPLSGGGRVGINAGGADLVGLPLLHAEAKRTERLNIRAALRQALKSIVASRSPDVPVVITRQNREALEDSIVAMRLGDFIALYRSHLVAVGHVRNRPSPAKTDDPLEF